MPQPVEVRTFSCAPRTGTLEVRVGNGSCCFNPLDELPVFDDNAQVVVPLQKPVDRYETIAAIEKIGDRGSTNPNVRWLISGNSVRASA
jgi:hypothetical protein